MPANLPVRFGGQLQYNHDSFMTSCIENLGRDQFRQELHLDEQGREITAVSIEELVKVRPESNRSVSRL